MRKFNYENIVCEHKYTKEEMRKQIEDTHWYMIKHFSKKRHKIIKEKTLDALYHYCYPERRKNEIS